MPDYALVNGHPYTKQNTGTASNGYRFCRACKREWARPLYRSRRA